MTVETWLDAPVGWGWLVYGGALPSPTGAHKRRPYGWSSESASWIYREPGRPSAFWTPCKELRAPPACHAVGTGSSPARRCLPSSYRGHPVSTLPRLPRLRSGSQGCWRGVSVFVCYISLYGVCSCRTSGVDGCTCPSSPGYRIKSGKTNESVPPRVPVQVRQDVAFPRLTGCPR